MIGRFVVEVCGEYDVVGLEGVKMRRGEVFEGGGEVEVG